LLTNLTLSARATTVEQGIAPEQIIGTKYVNDDPTQGHRFPATALCVSEAGAVAQG
jgi:hypothetical protein